MISLKKNELFRSVFKNGRYLSNKYLVMYVLENSLNHNRIGIQVSKKVGNSVIRHRLTRLVRESYRLNEEKFNSGLDIVIVARVYANTVKKCNEIEIAMMNLAERLKVLNKDIQ